jgi:hypothetical protein
LCLLLLLLLLLVGGGGGRDGKATAAFRKAAARARALARTPSCRPLLARAGDVRGCSGSRLGPADGRGQVGREALAPAGRGRELDGGGCVDGGAVAAGRRRPSAAALRREAALWFFFVFFFWEGVVFLARSV